MAINKEGIFGTRPWEETFSEGPSAAWHPDEIGPFGVVGEETLDAKSFTSADIRYTESKNGSILYAYFLAMSADRQFLLKALSLQARSVISQAFVKTVTLLGSNENIEWKQDKDGLHIKLPIDYTAIDNVGGLKIGLQ